MSDRMSCTSEKLSWDELVQLVTGVIERQLGRKVRCRASMEDCTYWCVSATDARFTIAEIEQLLRFTGADEDIRLEALPTDAAASYSFGMGLSRLLLKEALCADWEQEMPTKECLWLISLTDTQRIKADQPNIMRLPDMMLDMNQLQSQRELTDYLKENGATHAALMDFCEPYRERYHNELCWPYPISDGKHLGTFLVLVREGVLSLPYDEADKEDYELFCLEDACLCDSDAMQIFLSDWKRFTDDLQFVMSDMMVFLMKKERQVERDEQKS